MAELRHFKKATWRTGHEDIVWMVCIECAKRSGGSRRGANFNRSPFCVGWCRFGAQNEPQEATAQTIH